MCYKSPSAVNSNRKSIFWRAASRQVLDPSKTNLCPTPPKYQLTKLLTWKPKGTHQAKSMFGICAKPWKHMRKVHLTACAPCALHLLKISWQKLLTWKPKGQIKRGKSSQKHPGDMREAIKNTCAKDCSQPINNLQSKISTSVPANLAGAVNYDRKQRIL